MKISLKIIILLSLIQSFSCRSFEQKLTVEKPTNNFQTKVDSIVLTKMNQYHIPGLSIGMVKNGSMIYSKGYGVKNITTNNPVTENTIFHTASISKLFTAVAIMNLVEEGVFQLEDKLVKLIPELGYDDPRVNQISVKNLLNHTSGLKDIKSYNWRKNHQSDHSLKDYVLSQKLKPKTDPCLLYTSPSPRDKRQSRMPSSA